MDNSFQSQTNQELQETFGIKKPSKLKRIVIFIIILLIIALTVSVIIIFHDKNKITELKGYPKISSVPNTIQNSFENVTSSLTQEPRTISKQPRLIFKDYKKGIFISSYTPDLEHYALLHYQVKNDGRKDCVLYFDGKSAPDCDIMIKKFSFSDDGKNTYYVLPDEKLLFYTAIINNKRENNYRKIYQFIYSPDNQKYIYSANDTNKFKDVLIENGVDKNLDIYLIDQIAVSNDGTILVVAAQKDQSSEKRVIIVNGKEQYEEKGQIVFLQVGNNGDVGYIFKEIRLIPGKDRFTTIVEDFYTVINGKRFGPFSSVSNLVFSHDGKKNAFSVKDQSKGVLYINNNPVVTLSDNQYISNIKFSPDGKHLVYVTESESPNSTFLIVDNKKFGPYSYIGQFSFSSDSQNFAYIATEKIPIQKVSIYLNGIILRTGDFDVYSPILFSNDNTNIMYYGFRGDDLWFEVQVLKK